MAFSFNKQDVKKTLKSIIYTMWGGFLQDF